MWKFLLALLIPAGAVLAQENLSAYEALRVMGTQLNRQIVNRIVSVNGIDGVATTSEGEEPHRRVVISPADQA